MQRNKLLFICDNKTIWYKIEDLIVWKILMDCGRNKIGICCIIQIYET